MNSHYRHRSLAAISVVLIAAWLIWVILRLVVSQYLWAGAGTVVVCIALVCLRHVDRES
jgi:hypothetical protein